MSNIANAGDPQPQVPVINEQPPLEQVLEAIHTLNHGTVNSDKQVANSWLTSVQHSVYAWQLADQLLIRKHDIESCYFGAQTLRTKLQNNFSELPQNAYASLRTTIIQHLQTFDEKVIQTQLSTCVAYLVILDTSWTNPIDELVNSGLNWYVLVEIITHILEESNKAKQQSIKGVTAARRQQVLKYLTSIGPKMINFLTNTLNGVKQQLPAIIDRNNMDQNHQMAEKLIAKIYRCLGAWFNVLDIDSINLIEPLLTSIFASLQDPNTSDIIHDAAADTVCGAALLCEDYEKYHQLAQYLLVKVYQLEGVYQHSVDNEDLDKSVNYSRIFTELAESIIGPLIVETSCTQNALGPIPAQHLVDLVLRCIDHFDTEVAEITFHFWYRFAEFLHKRDDNSAHTYGQHVMKLLDGLACHCQLDPDQEGLLYLEAEVNEFRLRVKDLVKEVVVIVGATNYLRHNNIVTNLKISFTQMARDQSNWEQDEAYLFMIDCLIKDIYDDNVLVTEIVNLILATQQHNPMNPNCTVSGKSFHPQILYTCCRILGQLGDWLENQPRDFFNEVLNYLLPFVTTTQQASPKSGPSNHNVDWAKTKLQSVSLSSVAAEALHNIISSCASRHLIGNQEVILLFIRLCTQLDELDEQAAYNLVQCCATMITQSSEEKNRIDQELLVVKILEPSIVCLNHIVSGTHHNICKSDPVIYMDRISSVFRSLKLKPRDPTITPNESPLDMKIMEIWKLLEAILKHISSSSDTRIVEKACRSLRYVIRCLRPIHLLIPVAECIVNLYSQYPHHSCYLYLASILVDEFGNTKDLSITDADREKIDNGLLEMLQHFWRPTFALLSSPNVELKNHPDTIDDFCRLCTRFLQKNPARFISFSLLGQILELTLASLQIDHRDANTSVCKLIVELIEKGRSSEPSIRDMVERLLTSSNDNSEPCYGQKLMNTLINCALFVLPTFYIPELADIIWNLVNWDKMQACTWLEKTLHSLSLHAQPTSPEAPSSQIQDFYDTVKKASNLKLVVSSLRCLSRGYR